MKIKEVILHFPMSQQGEVLGWEVGRNCTEIRETERYTEFCKVKYYEIYKNNDLIAELHHFSEVRYTDKEVKSC